MAWAFNDEEPEIWTPGMPLPERIYTHVALRGEFRAWNAQFERLIWKYIMVDRYGAPIVNDEQWHDTAAEAAAMALPRSLDQAAKVTGVAQQKDDAGYRLMLQMSKPRRIEPDGTVVWWDTPAKMDALLAYCKQDVRTERAIMKALRRLGAHERQIYLLDQRVNDRGIRVDRALVNAAQAVADTGVERANVVLRQLTNGTVSEVTNHKKLTEWLQSQGVDTDSVSKVAVREMLEGEDLTPIVREALETRADAGRTSVAKLRAFLDVAGVDDRLRGLLLYHAASTGRWGGKLVQPQNFPRGEVKGIEQLIPLVLAEDYDTLDLVAHPIIVVSSMLRSMLTAQPGFELMVADFASIEAVIVNWLAGQDDVLDDFRAYLGGDKNRDPYKLMAVRMGRAKTPAEVTKEDRNAGKAAELGCGFGMGPAKFVSAAWATYGVRVTESQAADAVKIYRSSHGRVKQFWRDAENAVKNAIQQPNVPFKFGAESRLTAIVAGAYLYVILPSGRPLCYAAPRLVVTELPWGGEGEQIEYSAVNSLTHSWGRERTYGGKLVENIVQAVARDLMADAMLRAEERGYIPILSVHDEVIAEVEAGQGDVKEFEGIMCELPEWAAGCPVAAEGWRGFRYRK